MSVPMYERLLADITPTHMHVRIYPSLLHLVQEVCGTVYHVCSMGGVVVGVVSTIVLLHQLHEGIMTRLLLDLNMATLMAAITLDVYSIGATHINTHTHTHTRVRTLSHTFTSTHPSTHLEPVS